MQNDILVTIQQTLEKYANSIDTIKYSIVPLNEQIPNLEAMKKRLSVFFEYKLHGIEFYVINDCLHIIDPDSVSRDVTALNVRFSNVKCIDLEKQSYDHYLYYINKNNYPQLQTLLFQSNFVHTPQTLNEDNHIFKQNKQFLPNNISHTFQTIDLRNNEIEDLQFLMQCDNLRNIKNIILELNRISNVYQIFYLLKFRRLEYVNLMQNPVALHAELYLLFQFIVQCFGVKSQCELCYKNEGGIQGQYELKPTNKEYLKAFPFKTEQLQQLMQTICKTKQRNLRQQQYNTRILKIQHQIKKLKRIAILIGFE